MCADVPASSTFTVGGTISGLGASKIVVLQNNAGDDISVSANGAFTFATAINSGSTYAVTVKTQPTGQTCTVTNGSGTASANVSNVAVTCTTNTYTIGGNASGLGTGKTVVLQNNAGDDLTVSTNGAFTFATAINSGSTYAVTVKTQPTGQTCAVTNGSGTASANVSNVAVTCTTNTYTIGGNASGLGTGKTVVLQNNAGDDLTVSTNGAFTFATAINFGSSYAVTVKTQPTNQTCTVSSGSGTISANVTNVAVACTDNIVPPGPPTGVSVSAVGGTATVSFTAPSSNGGASITSYTVTCTSSDGGASGTTPGTGSPIAVTGLTVGKTYTCAVAATNSAGTGSASAGITPFVMQAPQPIPTLSEWVMILLASLIGIAGYGSLRRRLH